MTGQGRAVGRPPMDGVSEMPVLAVRMPAMMIADVKIFGGRDSEGASGVVREAVREWLDRQHRQEAA